MLPTLQGPVLRDLFHVSTALGRAEPTHANRVDLLVDGEATYAASDPDLLRWVHVAFTDSFLAAHRAWGGPIPGGEDAYVREWATAGCDVHTITVLFRCRRTGRPVSLYLAQQQRHLGVSLADKLSALCLQLDAFCK